MKKIIGIAGGGQLGRMLCSAAKDLGFDTVVLDPTPNSPAAQVANQHIVGSFKDKEKIIELADKCDFLTCEIEGVSIEGLEEIEKSKKPVNPSSKIIKIIRDKFAQKTFLQNNNLPVGEFALIEGQDDAKMQGKIFGYPYLLKARFDAYDGRGNSVIEAEEDIPGALEKLSGSPLYAEKFIPFVKELAVISARDTFGNIQNFEVVETVHKNNICHIVRHPAGVSAEIKDQAREIANSALGALGGIGIFAVEMFLTQENEILINEIAPRVHNSGHHTIEAYSVSQFEQHIRAIAGMELKKPEPLSKAAVMVNILGERDGKAQFQSQASDSAHVHIYGKMETRKERKMGHLTVLEDGVEEAERKALDARNKISI